MLGERAMSLRKSKGQSMIVLVLLISIFILLAAGLFGFELNRMEVARQQLRSACDAAALSAAATLASSNNTNTSQSQTTAMDTALTTFQQNSIIGKTLANAVITYSNPDNPGPNNSSIYIQFLDPNNSDRPVQLGDPKGKVVQVTANFGLQPAFGVFLGLPNVDLHEVSLGGVPSLDVALCFDVSASIDDQTPVTFVRRQWNATKNTIDYIVPPCQKGAPAGALAQGPIFSILGPPAIGSPVDALPPQNLFMANYPGENQYPLNFSEDGSAPGLRGKTNAGSPPGNYPGQGAGTGNQYTFTDLVVNIDGNNQFGGFTTATGYAFPNLATVVEAARGNLENTTVFVNSKANLAVPSNVTPRAGYQAAYVAAAMANIHPLGDAQVASQQFLSIMNNDTDAHFSLVAFTSNAGTSPTSTYSDYIVDPYYSQGGRSTYPVPLIALNPATYQTNYTTCYNLLPTTVATSGTNIGDAINTAYNQLQANGRKGAKKAIVLFTDGEPTSAGPLDTKDPWNNARLAAAKCKPAGIPIYAIGLAQIPQIVPSETAILNATNSDPKTGGVAGIAGNGGEFFLVTKTSDLQLTFENIARQLVQLVK